MSDHKYTVVDKEEVFVIYYDGKPMHVQTTRIYDWKPPKKLYFTMGAAKCGVTNLPDEVDRSKVSIVRYVPERARA